MSVIKMADLDLQGKRVLIREDLNVPVKNGKVASDARIVAALPTIRLALEKGAAVIVCSHLGRPTEGEFSGENSLQPVADYLSQALGRLLAVSESYPDLKANANFQNLQAQLEGTENRINVARNDFNEAVNGYNSSVRAFPTNIVAGIAGFKQKGYFEAAAGAENAPQVKF